MMRWRVSFGLATAIFAAIAFRGVGAQAQSPPDFGRPPLFGATHDSSGDYPTHWATNHQIQAPDPEVLQRLEALEKAFQKQEEAAAKKKSDDAHKPTLRWTGRVHWDYWGWPNESPLANALETGSTTTGIPDRFAFRRVRLGVQGTILETMEYKAEFDLAEVDDPRFKDVYIGWNELPILQTVLLGNQKRPYGLDHLNSSRYNVFIERPFIVEAFNQDARRFGLCSYGVSDDESWNWRLGTYLLEDIQATGDYRADAYQMELAGRLANTIWYDETSDGRGYAHWAIAGTLADPNPNPGGNASNQARFRTRPESRTNNRWFDTGAIAGAETYQILALEGVINVGPVQVVGEYQNMWLHRDTATGPDLDFSGGYLYISYFLTGEHVPWERFSGTIGRVKPFENFFLVDRCTGGRGWGWGAWQLAARYSHVDFNDDNILGGIGDSFTFGLNWWWTPYSRLQFNYIHGSVQDHETVTTGTPPVVVVAGPASGNYDVFGARFSVDF